MSRATGRRSALPGLSTGRATVMGIMIVGLVLGMLTVAGTTPRGIGRPVGDAARVSLDQRTFGCTGGISGTTARTGNVRSGLSRAVQVGKKPYVLDVDRAQASEAFAAQESRTRRSLAWLPCPEPRARWWFVAASAAVTRDSVLTVTNPRSGAAVIDIDAIGPEGRIASPALHGITIAPGGTQSFDLAERAPALGNVAVSVVAKRGLVVASATEQFRLGGIGTDVDEWLPPQSLPSNRITLAGLLAKPDTATLVVANPGQVDAIATVRVIGPTGTFEPSGLEPIRIAPESVATVPVSAIFDGKPLALRITAPEQITATVRMVKGSDVAYSTGVQMIRGTTAFAVPEGSGRLVISSIANAGSVRLTAYDGNGKQVLARTIAVKAQTSASVAIPAKARYFRLVADRRAVVAGFTIEGKRGIAAAGVVPAIRSVLLPVVRPGW